MKIKNHLTAILALSLGVSSNLQAAGTEELSPQQANQPQNTVPTPVNQAAQNLNTQLERLNSLYEPQTATPAEARAQDDATLRLEGYDFNVPGALEALLNVVHAITPQLTVGGQQQATPLYTALELKNCTLLTENDSNFELFKSIARQKLHTLSLEGSTITPSQLRLLLSTLGPDNYNSRITTLKAKLTDEAASSRGAIPPLARALSTMIQHSPVQSLILKENTAPHFRRDEDRRFFMNGALSTFAGNRPTVLGIRLLHKEGRFEDVQGFDAARKHVTIEFKNEIWTLSPEEPPTRALAICKALPETSAGTEAPQPRVRRKRTRETATEVGRTTTTQSTQEETEEAPRAAEPEAAQPVVDQRQATPPAMQRRRLAPRQPELPARLNRNLFGDPQN